MITPHPNADMLRAIADGKQMQGRLQEDGCDWFDIYPDQAIGAIASDYSMKVRIKPETVLINGIECPAPMRVAPAAAAQGDALVQALIGAQRAINSMKAEAETAAQGDEQMMLDACEQISNEGLEASLAIQAVIDAAQPPADGALNTIAAMFHSGEEIEGPDGLAVMVDMALWNEALEAFDVVIGDEMEPAQGDAEDAARYRYLKKYKTWDSTDVFYWLRCAPADEVDSIIDAARGAQGESNG